MAELITTDRYVVRIYRRDPEDDHKLMGLVEFMDGSGTRKPFADLHELASVLNKQRRGDGQE
jgi:hypothetical protein